MRTHRSWIALGAGFLALVASVPPASAGGGIGFTLTASIEGAGHPFEAGSQHRVLITVSDDGEASLRNISLTVRDLLVDADPGDAWAAAAMAPREIPPITCDGGPPGPLSLEPGQSLHCTTTLTAAAGTHTVVVTASATIPGELTPRIRTRSLGYTGLMPPPPAAASIQAPSATALKPPATSNAQRPAKPSTTPLVLRPLALNPAADVPGATRFPSRADSDPPGATTTGTTGTTDPLTDPLTGPLAGPLADPGLPGRPLAADPLAGSPTQSVPLPITVPSADSPIGAGLSPVGSNGSPPTSVTDPLSGFPADVPDIAKSLTPGEPLRDVAGGPHLRPEFASPTGPSSRSKLKPTTRPLPSRHHLLGLAFTGTVAPLLGLAGLSGVALGALLLIALRLRRDPARTG